MHRRVVGHLAHDLFSLPENFIGDTGLTGIKVALSANRDAAFGYRLYTKRMVRSVRVPTYPCTLEIILVTPFCTDTSTWRGPLRCIVFARPFITTIHASALFTRTIRAALFLAGSHIFWSPLVVLALATLGARQRLIGVVQAVLRGGSVGRRRVWIPGGVLARVRSGGSGFRRHD